MKKIIWSLFLFFLLSQNILQAQSIQNNWIFKTEDKHLAEDKLALFSAKSSQPISELITEIGLSFLGTPYVAATLENGIEEKLVINLRELDCTTFAENCLALARTVKMGKRDFNSFASELEHIRYRNGIRDQYLSRLHYFSEWIHNNHSKKNITEDPNLLGEKLNKDIRFMSAHHERYPVLKAHPELISELVKQEKQITASGFYYFPKNKPEKLAQVLRQGDIIGLTTSIDGLDITHVGIIVIKDNLFCLLHASQSSRQVVLSEGPITDFIKSESKNTGIVIARPVF